MHSAAIHQDNAMSRPPRSPGLICPRYPSVPRTLLATLIFALICCTGGLLHADELVWEGGESSDWNDPANWRSVNPPSGPPAGPPGPDDDACIPPNTLHAPRLPQGGVVVNTLKLGDESHQEAVICGPMDGDAIIRARNGITIHRGGVIKAEDGSESHNDGRSVRIESEQGGITNNGEIRGGNGHGSGNGGAADVKGRDNVTNGGTITGGKGHNGGDACLESEQGKADNTRDGKVRGGDANDRTADDEKSAGDGGNAKIKGHSGVTNEGEVTGGKGGDGRGPGKGGNAGIRIGSDRDLDNSNGKVTGGKGGDARKRPSDDRVKGGRGGDASLEGKQGNADVGTIKEGDAKPGQGGKDDPHESDEDRGPNGKKRVIGREVYSVVSSTGETITPRSIHYRAAHFFAPEGDLPITAFETIVIDAHAIDFTGFSDGIILDAGVQIVLAGEVLLDPGVALEDIVSGHMIRNPQWLSDFDPETLIEPEPCGEFFNPGCDSFLGEDFTLLPMGDAVSGSVWASGFEADSDWYHVLGIRPGDQHLDLRADFDALVLVFDGSTCDAPVVYEGFVLAGDTLAADLTLSWIEALVMVAPVGGELHCDEGANRYTMALRGGETTPPPCYADCDGNGRLDIFDFLCFLNAFLEGDPYADCDGSGELSIFDFLCFQNAFLEGCP